MRCMVARTVKLVDVHYAAFSSHAVADACVVLNICCDPARFKINVTPLHSHHSVKPGRPGPA